MTIIGIDYEKCDNCGICVYACPHPDYYFTKIEEEDKIIYDSHGKKCSQCGQCIAQCHKEAILYDGIGEHFSFKGIEEPKTITSYETIFNTLVACRSIRRYQKEKIPEKLLDKVINAMGYAPTSANLRPENFLIISDPEMIKSLSDAVFEEHRRDISLWNRFGEQMLSLDKIFHSPIYFDAPHVIIVSSPLNMIMGAFNIGNIITYGRLTAQTLGLGTCWNGWTNLAIHNNPKIKRLVKIRGNLVCAFTIGYPDVTYYRVPPRSKKQVRVI